MKFVTFNKKTPIILAPMAGITDLAFRTVCREEGADFCYTEMVSAKALIYQDQKTRSLLKTNEDDVPLCVQLFGKEPEVVSEAAKIIEDMGFTMIDLNAGCPAPKITGNGEGSALMKDPILLGKIVEQTAKSVSIPLSVKIRSGYSSDSINAMLCAKIIEESGAKVITVHGRTRDQFYSGTADYDIIKKVKEIVSIPVIGNGDVFSPPDAKRLLDHTGCDGVMVGRGALGRPYLFRQIKDFFENNSWQKEIPLATRISLLKRHILLMTEFKEEKRSILEARKHLAWYLKGLPNSKALREATNQVNSLEDVFEICNFILDS